LLRTIIMILSGIGAVGVTIKGQTTVVLRSSGFACNL